jgi:hypothetical protein
MTPSLLSHRLPRAWRDFAQALIAAPARRAPDFANTEPVIFRSECFAEDLLPTDASRSRPHRRAAHAK